MQHLTDADDTSGQDDFKISVRVPNGQHKLLIGKLGSVLNLLRDTTAVRTTIEVLKSDANSDTITITGPKEGLEQVMQEIQLICKPMDQDNDEATSSKNFKMSVLPKTRTESERTAKKEQDFIHIPKALNTTLIGKDGSVHDTTAVRRDNQVGRQLGYYHDHMTQRGSGKNLKMSVPTPANEKINYDFALNVYASQMCAFS